MEDSQRFRYSDFPGKYLSPPNHKNNNKNLFDTQSFCSIGLDDDTQETHEQPFLSKQSFKNIFNPLGRKETLSEIEERNKEDQMIRLRQERLRYTLSPRHQSTDKIKSSLNNYFNARLSLSREQKNASQSKPIEQTLENIQIKIQSMKEFMFKKAVKEQKMQENRLSKNKQKNEIFQRKQYKERLSIESSFSKKNVYESYKNVGSIYYVSELVKRKGHKNSRELDHVFQTLKIFRYLDDFNINQVFKRRPERLDLRKHPLHENKKTIIFDLDETLIHCTQTRGSECDVVLTIKEKGQAPSEARINIRPYTLTFLKKLAEEFELMIFTASEACYADVVLDYLDPQNKLFQHRLYRQHCCSYQDGYIKDLRIINRQLSDMVIVDNSAYSYCLQLDNAIPIFPYYQGSDDTEFKSLQKYLNKLKHVKDVREINSKTFRFQQYLSCKDQLQIIDRVYQSSN